MALAASRFLLGLCFPLGLAPPRLTRPAFLGPPALDLHGCTLPGQLSEPRLPGLGFARRTPALLEQLVPSFRELLRAVLGLSLALAALFGTAFGVRGAPFCGTLRRALFLEAPGPTLPARLLQPPLGARRFFRLRAARGNLLLGCLPTTFPLTLAARLVGCRLFAPGGGRSLARFLRAFLLCALGPRCAPSLLPCLGAALGDGSLTP